MFLSPLPQRLALLALLPLLPLLCLAPGARAQSEPVVTLAAAERAPYIGKALPEQGYVAEVAREAFRRRGYRVQLEFFPLARAQQLVNEGEVDALLPALLAADDSRLAFSSPFPGDSIGLLKKKSLNVQFDPVALKNGTDRLAALNRYRYGVVRGSAQPGDFQTGQVAHRETATDDLQNLDKLERDRIDFALIDKYTAADLMAGRRPHLIGRFDFMRPALAQRDFHLAFSTARGRQAPLLAAFNAGLEEMRRDGSLTAIQTRHGLFPPAAAAKNKAHLVIATVNNNDMLVMRKLAAHYEKLHPDTELEWRVMDEAILRLRLLSDFAIADGQFDVLTIGTYETPLWAKRGWLAPQQPPADYAPDDLLPTVRAGLSYQRQLYALPFYGESTMTYYRKDLFAKAGLRMPAAPTYAQIRDFASRLHKPAEGVYGVCLRGKPGWGDNMALLTTIINVFGGRWFDERGRPELDSPAWQQGLAFYTELLRHYGPPQPEHNGFNENLKLFAEGHCAIWVDATVAAGMLSDPKRSSVAADLGYVSAPTAVTAKGAAWLWSWALAVPNSSQHKAEAARFIAWATSKDYIRLVAKSQGWLAIPPGTRKSTYQNEDYLKAAPFARFVLNAIESANPGDATLKPSPYPGIQYIGIPEFPALGDQVGREVARTLACTQSARDTLAAAQALVLEQMKNSSYVK